MLVLQMQMCLSFSPFSKKSQGVGFIFFSGWVVFVICEDFLLFWFGLVLGFKCFENVILEKNVSLLLILGLVCLLSDW